MAIILFAFRNHRSNFIRSVVEFFPSRHWSARKIGGFEKWIGVKVKSKLNFIIFFITHGVYSCNVYIYIYVYKVFRDAALISSFRNKGVECHKALLSQPYRNG